MEPIKNENFFLRALFQQIHNDKDYLIKSTYPKDTAEISNTAKVFDKLDKFLNLGKSNRLDIDDLNDKEKEEFMKMLAELLKRGIVGYEILEVNGRPEKHYIVNQIGNERIYGAKLYKRKGYYND
ncbi:hypothetical protein [Rosettibacter firmus]|uniref:hypothetical protein n=1 Tax=Rosettibacter firmus TaxID=3111522 RepID=UPI00336BFD16